MSELDSPQAPTVLVVDDEPIILQSVRAALSADHKLLEADTALKALEIAKSFRGVIDLVMADRTLKGTTGRQVIAKIRSTRPAVRVLYFSSYSRDHPANEGLPADAEILEKPFLPRDLRGTVFRILQDRPSDKADTEGSPQPIEPDRAIDVRNPECLEILRDEVFRNRSLFGRLMSASTLWTSKKNRYEHRLSTRYGIRDVDEALRLVHHEALVSWLSLSLRQKKADVTIYLAGGCNPAGKVRQLQSLGRTALPQAAIEPERHLFLSELTVIQRILLLEL
jgi:DNA-binding response OmpR family regulator